VLICYQELEIDRGSDNNSFPAYGGY